jgi:hypothetical protein
MSFSSPNSSWKIVLKGTGPAISWYSCQLGMILPFILIVIGAFSGSHG